jgi:DNA-binding PadR family transcriptional regulator
LPNRNRIGTTPALRATPPDSGGEYSLPVFKWSYNPDESLIDSANSFDYIFTTSEYMAQRNHMSNFELMVMLVLIRLGEEAYGVPISREIERTSGREVPMGSVYATLERLEAKGMVAAELGEPTVERGGRAKRYFKVTKSGLREVRETQRTLMQLWKNLPALERGRA